MVQVLKIMGGHFSPSFSRSISVFRKFHCCLLRVIVQDSVQKYEKIKIHFRHSVENMDILDKKVRNFAVKSAELLT